MIKRSLILIVMLVLNLSSTFAQSLKNGPMLTYLAMRETAIWVQTHQSSDVQLRYWSTTTPNKKYHSEPIKTSKAHAFTATLVADSLDLGTTYLYEVLLNGKVVKSFPDQKFTTKSLWKWRTDAPDFSFLAGSCSYINETAYDRPGKPYGGDYETFTSMAKEDARFMVWLGDNTYLRESDWDSKSGIQHRFTHSRSTPEMQSLLRKMHNYATWDDHDYGPNDSEWTYPLKHEAKQTFMDFFPSNTYGAGHSEGVTSFFDWSDCDFFMMDDRWYRTSQGQDGQMLGNQQMDWLITSLRSSLARFKFVAIGSQVLNSSKSKENHINYTNERTALLQAIEKYNIKGVIFLTGDRHHSEISKVQFETGLEVYDITTSPLAAGAATNVKEINNNRIEGSLIDGKRNYAVITVKGKGEERIVEVVYKDKDGVELKRFVIKN